MKAKKMGYFKVENRAAYRRAVYGKRSEE